MNKRFTNKKPYAKTGMAKRHDRLKTFKRYRESILKLIQEGRI